MSISELEVEGAGRTWEAAEDWEDSASTFAM
jgi:hypothetical protein